MKPQKSIMPAVIVCITLVGFYLWGSYVLYHVFAIQAGSAADPKAFSILDMFVVAAIGLATGGVGYWLGNTHADQNKDLMLHNSTPSLVPTEQVVKSIVMSPSTPESEVKS